MNRATLAKFVYAILIALLARKVYIILYKWPDFKGYYSRLNASELASVDPRVIIDRQVSVQLQSKNDSKDKVSIFILILSAPLNSIERQMTREVLSAVAKKDLKWAFLIGQTQSDVQVLKLLTAPCIEITIQAELYRCNCKLRWKNSGIFFNFLSKMATKIWPIKVWQDLRTLRALIPN